MGNNANFSSGSTFRGALKDLDYFDKLPPTARQALANAVFDWSSGAVFNRWKAGRRGYKTGKDVASRVSEWDARESLGQMVRYTFSYGQYRRRPADRLWNGGQGDRGGVGNFIAHIDQTTQQDYTRPY